MNKPTKNTSQWTSYLIGLLVLIGIIAAALRFYSNRNVEKNHSANPSKNTGIEVNAEVVGNEPIAEYITLNGVTRFLKTSTIRASVTGYITQLNYNINSRITKGSLFCTIKTKEQDALQGIQRLDSSLNVFNKPIRVFSNGSGLISAMSVHAGDYVAEGEVLAEITEPSSLILVVNVPYEYGSQIHIGTACEVIFSDTKKMNLTINGVLPTIESASQTQSYYITLPDKNLPENLNVTINLRTKNSVASSLTIPAIALQTDELEKEYWVMKILNGIAYKVPVVIGSQNSDYVEIKQGDIAYGDSIVTYGSYQLDDSSLVTIQQ